MAPDQELAAITLAAAEYCQSQSRVIAAVCRWVPMLAPFCIVVPFLGSSVKVLRSSTSVIKRVAAAVAEEYTRELDNLSKEDHGQLAERVRRLLSGEFVRTSDITYEFEDWHLGVVATGPEVSRVVRELAKALDRRLLLVSESDDTVWAWLGGRQMPAIKDALAYAKSASDAVTIAFGEPASGLQDVNDAASCDVGSKLAGGDQLGTR